MKNFDSGRFGNLMRYELMTNKRNIINMMLIMTIAQTFFYASTSIMTLQEHSDCNKTDVLSGLLTITFSMFCIFATLGASRIFNNMRRKQDRISFLTLPATNAEKFLARYLFATVGYLIMYTVSFILADALNRIVTGIVCSTDIGSVFLMGIRYTHEISLLILDEIVRHENERILIISTVFLAVLSVLLSGSIYIFGGSIFCRNHWVLTTFSMTMVFFVFILLHFRIIDFLIRGTGTALLIWVADLLMLILIVALHYLAWKVFCRMQVKTGKWTNL
ncbi:MAG: hypothetical protein ACI4TW_03730 [Prevotella sp.]